MSIRIFFFVSLMLAILAVGSHVAAIREFGRGSSTIARAFTRPAATPSKSDHSGAKSEARRSISRGGVFIYVGYALALSSVGFVFASARRHEPAWRSLTISLLIFYVMMQFVMV